MMAEKVLTLKAPATELDDNSNKNLDERDEHSSRTEAPARATSASTDGRQIPGFPRQKQEEEEDGD